MVNLTATQFLAAAKTETVYKQTITYLQRHIQQFLRPRELVLICSTDRSEFGMASMFEKAVRRAEGIPLLLEDMRWQTVLKTAFFSRATVVVGPPLLILGLTKLAKHTGTPLNIRHVLLAGAPCEDWMMDGIRHGLDAAIWGCYDPVPGLVVGGFSCEVRQGVHIREELDVRVHPDSGQILLSWKDLPDAVYAAAEKGRLCSDKCPCGSTVPRLLNFEPLNKAKSALSDLQEYLLSWTSVLDYRARQTEMGLELEVVAFPGERLPKLPSCARRLVRQWVPKEDVPFESNFSAEIS